MSQSSELETFAAMMRRLRVECAWKAEQTHESLLPYLREETTELAAAVDAGDDVNLCEELGDVLLQVVFHAVMAEQRGAFTLDDVARGITEKMIRRNPHVFDPASLGRTPDSPPLTPDEIDELWQQAKAAEKQ